MDDSDYAQVVADHHESLYRFAFSLVGASDDAAELTQETYVRLLTKGAQLRDSRKVKSWLFMTLYRIFLGWKRHQKRFPHIEICEAENELPSLTPRVIDQMDSELVMQCLLDLDEIYRVPLTLFYLQNLSYREIAEIVDVPVGTVMSRLSRAKDLLRQRLLGRAQNDAPETNTRAIDNILTLKVK